MLDRGDDAGRPARGRDRGRRADRRVVATTRCWCRVTRACPDPEPPLVIDAVYKPTLGERPLDDFPRRHAGPPRGRGLARVRGDRLGDRPADDPARRPVRRGDGPGVRRGRSRGRRRRDGPRGRCRGCAGWRSLDAVHEQHRPQGRPHPAGRWRPARPRRRPRRLLLARAEAADGAVGLARHAVRSPTSSRAWNGPRRRSTASSARTLRPLLSRLEVRATPAGGWTRCSRPAASRCPSPNWPAIPWPPF